MYTFDDFNKFINIAIFIGVGFYFIRIYRQIQSTNVLDLMEVYFKHRRTIFEQMQSNPQVRNQYYFQEFFTYGIGIWWLITAANRFVLVASLSHLLNLLLTLFLLIFIMFNSWQNHYLMAENRYLTWNNRFQKKHYNDILNFFTKRLEEWQNNLKTDMLNATDYQENDLTTEDEKQLKHFQSILAAVKAEPRKQGMFSETLFQLFDDKLILHSSLKPLDEQEKRLLAYYVGYWNADPYWDYQLGLLSDMKEELSDAAQKSLNRFFYLIFIIIMVIAIIQIFI